MVVAGAEPLSVSHPDGAGGERLAGVVRAALPASGSKGAADARGDCLSALAALQSGMPELIRRRSPDAPEECWHVYYGDVRVGTTALRTGMPHHEDPWGNGYQIRSSGLISFAIIRFRSNLTACGTGRASAIQYRDVRSLTCRNLAALRWLKPSLAIAAPYCWPVMALRFTIIWGFGRMRYRNPRIQVLLLRANDLGFVATGAPMSGRVVGQFDCGGVPGWKTGSSEGIFARCQILSP